MRLSDLIGPERRISDENGFLQGLDTFLAGFADAFPQPQGMRKTFVGDDGRLYYRAPDGSWVLSNDAAPEARQMANTAGNLLPTVGISDVADLSVRGYKAAPGTLRSLMKGMK